LEVKKVYDSVCNYIEAKACLIKAQALDYEAIAKTREPYDCKKDDAPPVVGFAPSEAGEQ
jgi:hypothetical protein